MITCKRIRTFVILVSLVVTARAGLGATWQGDDLTSSNDWHTAENWDTGVVPGVGATVGEDVLIGVANPDMIDLNGTNVTVGQITVTQPNQDFLTTGGPATINCSRFYIDNQDNNTEVWPDLVVDSDIYSRRKSSNQKFYGSVTADSLDLGQGATTFSGPVTITGSSGIEVFYRSIFIGGGPVYTFESTITSANGGAVYSINASTPARLVTGATNTLGGITGALNINENGQLELAVTPMAFPSGGVVVNQYGLLVGDSGAATWGSGKDIDVTADGILALTAGSEPTASDIGVGVCWKGVLTDGLTEAGNDGVGVYKGLALGGFKNSVNNETLQSPAGAGDVAALVLPGLNEQSNQSLNLRSVDQTGTANFYCVGQFPSKGGRFNPTADASECRTINFVGQGGDTLRFVYLWNGFVTDSDHVLNFSGSGYVTIDPDNMQGKLSFSEDTMYNVVRSASDGPFKSTNDYPDVTLTFNDGAALAVENGLDLDILEDLDLESQVIMNGTPLLALRTVGSNNPLTISPQFDITAYTNLTTFMKNANICVSGGNNNYADLQGEGLILGDGKYLLGFSNSHKGIYLRAETAAKISAVGGVGTTMGIACLSGNVNDYLGIIIPVDGNGATLRLQNDVAMSATMAANNTRYTGIPNRKLMLMGPIEDTPEIEVRGVNVFFQSGVSVPADVRLTVQAGAVADLDTAVTVGTVAGNGQVKDATSTGFVFDTVAPGTSVGSIDMGAFTMPAGATYAWEIASTNSPGITYDLITGTTVTFGGAWTLQLDSDGFAGTLDGSEVFTIIDATSVVGFNAGNVTIISSDFAVAGASVYEESGDIKLTGVQNASKPGTVILIH